MNRENDIKTFYDLVAEQTADEWYQNEILLPSIKEFMALLHPKPRVLDLGCGPGYESLRLYREGASVVGIDFSEANIRIAKERNPDCQFEVMDFMNLDQRFGLFDGVFASGSLIHVASERIEEVFLRISEVLHDNGILLVIIRDGEGIDEAASNLTINGTILRRTVYRYTQDQMKLLGEKNNLKFIRNGYLDQSFIEYNWKSYIFKKQ